MRGAAVNGGGVRAQTAPTHRPAALAELLTVPSPDAERHASWLELFFDLVFVLALTASPAG